MTWPDFLSGLFSRSVTAEFASLIATGRPVTVPMVPFVGATGTLDVSTGLTYPAKAERARRNPRVCLLFARIWIEITPLRIRWWESREMAGARVSGGLRRGGVAGLGSRVRRLRMQLGASPPRIGALWRTARSPIFRCAT